MSQGLVRASHGGGCWRHSGYTVGLERGLNPNKDVSMADMICTEHWWDTWVGIRGPSCWQWLHRLYGSHTTMHWQVTQNAFLAWSQERKRQASALCTFLIVGPFNPFKTTLKPFKGIPLDVAPGKGVVPADRNILHCHLEQLFLFFYPSLDYAAIILKGKKNRGTNSENRPKMQ